MGKLTPEELDGMAEDYLLEVSSDDCWIDATSGFAKKKLVELLTAVRDGKGEADNG